MKLSPVAGLAALLLATPVLAQPVPPPPGLSTQGESIGISPPNPSQNSEFPGPAFHVFGLPVGINAPVNSPYMQSATTTFGGQPMNGADAVVSRGMGPNIAE